MSGQLATPLATTIVQVSAKLPNGTSVEQEIPIQHPAGAQSAAIVGKAFEIFKQMGGFLKDLSGNGLEFYMASKFDAPFTFEIKNVILVNQSLVNE